MEINISQDIRKFKTKDIGNFSFKEAVYIAIGAGLAFGLYSINGNNVPTAMIPFIISAMVGFLKPFGMSFLSFLKLMIKDMARQPVYINETDFEYEPDNVKEIYGNEYFMVASDDDLIQSESVNNK